jgi:exosortase A
MIATMPTGASMPMARSRASPGWRWPLFLLAILATVIFYWPTVAVILNRWTSDPTYSHGWLVLVISCWLVWRCWRRGELDDTRPSAWGLVPVLGAGLIWLLARAASIHVLQQLAVVTMMLGVAWALFGWRGFLALLVPIGVLYAVMPAWDYLRPLLQDITVQVTGVWLDALGVAAFIQGQRVSIAAGSFIIVEGCSGLHFTMAAAALGTIQAYLYIERRWAQALLVAAALAVALLANWIRVVAVIYAGHVTDMQSFLIGDHYYFGWIVFMLMMVPVFVLGRRLETPAAPRLRPAPHAAGLAPGLALPAATLIAVMLPALAWWAITTASPPTGPEPVLPARVGTWSLDGDAARDWQPLQPGAAVALGGRYTDGRRELDAWVVYYPRQSGGRQLVGYGSGVARPDDGRLSGAGAGPGELTLRSPWGAERLIRYRYEVAGRVTASRGRAKLYQALGNLGGRPDAYGLMISARCSGDACSEARRALQDFEAGIGATIPVAGGVPAPGTKP